MLVPQIVEFTGFRMGVNYGLEKVRFPVARARGQPHPGRRDPRQRDARSTAASTWSLTVTVEVEGGTKPAMVATTVVRRYL